MFVRVYDKRNDCYYKSIVYGTINEGWFLQYIVLNPYSKCFHLVEYLDKSEKPAFPLVESIQTDCSDFKVYENARLLKCKRYCKENGKSININRLWGYPDVCENLDFISDILENRLVPSEKYPIQLRQLFDENRWNYIRTQKDADEFMKVFAGFHDSTLDRLVYEEEHAYTKVTATFDNSSWYGVVELCFEGILSLNIRPARENYDRYISDATMLVKNEAIFWADEHMEGENPDYDGSYIKALNLKWRKMV